MAWSLPKLPGYSFEDVSKTRFHVPRKMDYKNGIPIVKLDYKAVGGKRMDAEEIKYVNNRTSSELDSNLMYNKMENDYLPIFKPHWVHYDKKFLTFKGYFKEYTGTLSDEVIRKVIVLYYLEDDTLTVIEPHIHNSGLIQGKLVKRGKIKKYDTDKFWHWKDFQIGMNFPVFGLVIHLSSCDEFTREFMSSQGINLIQDEDEPVIQTVKNSCRSISKSSGLPNFLYDDGTKLKFDVIGNDGETRIYKLLFFVYDKTIAIKECHVKNEGCDPFPMFLRRMKVPKNWRNISVNHPIFTQEKVIDDNEEFYDESDLLVGNTINILGRNFLIYNCDDYTRRYFKNTLNIDQNEALKFQQQSEEPRHVNIGPHIGIGDPEDTLMSCLTFHSKSPNKDVVQYNSNANKYLRYLCEMISVYPEDKDRKFVLSYRLADSTIRMDELPSDNSGLPAGRFSGPSKIQIPSGGLTDYYTPDMFYIGSIITVKSRKFRIVGADLFVYNYMKENPDKFPSELMENMRDYHIRLENLNQVNQTDDIEDIKIQAENIKLDDKIRTENMDTKWKPTELPAPLQQLECVQTLPEPVIKESEDQKIVCFTGTIPETHQIDENTQMPLVQETSNDETFYKSSDVSTSKKVSFKNLDDN